MTHGERVRTVLAGGTPDRTPFTFWYHFHLTPPAGPNMAEAELQFFRKYEPDIFKVMHDIEYEDSERVNAIGDWSKLRSMDGSEGNFGLQVETVRRIVQGVSGEDVPVINTVFNTFRYAHRISGERVLDHLREAPDEVHQGLRAITDSLVSFVRALMDVGANGIYYAMHGASSDMARPMEYQAHFLPYDREVLEAASSGWLNILHPHSYERLYFEYALELPAHVICWSDRAAGPALTEIRKQHAGCLMGGLDETRIKDRTPEQIIAEGREAREWMRGTPFVLAPGCSVPEDTPEHLLHAIAEAARG